MLNGTRILIVEDEALIALDLSMAVEERGGTVVGPAATVADALDLIAAEVIHAAILDGNLLDGEVTAAALALAARETPIVVYSALGAPPDLKAALPDIAVVSKPTPIPFVLARLKALLSD